MKPLFKTIKTLATVLLVVSLTACKDTGSKQTASVKPPKMDLQTAVLTNNTAAVKQHIAAGTNLNTQDPMSGATPLITAASFGKTAMTQLLIEGGADLSATNNDGATALHTAVFFCRVDIVKRLLDAGADPQARNKYGATPKATITGPFEAVKPIYEMLKQQLEPMGMTVDIDRIEQTRPTVAALLP